MSSGLFVIPIFSLVPVDGVGRIIDRVRVFVFSKMCARQYGPGFPFIGVTTEGFACISNGSLLFADSEEGFTTRDIDEGLWIETNRFRVIGNSLLLVLQQIAVIKAPDRPGLREPGIKPDHISKAANHVVRVSPGDDTLVIQFPRLISALLLGDEARRLLYFLCALRFSHLLFQ